MTSRNGGDKAVVMSKGIDPLELDDTEDLLCTRQARPNEHNDENSSTRTTLTTAITYAFYCQLAIILAIACFFGYPALMATWHNEYVDMCGCLVFFAIIYTLATATNALLVIVISRLDEYALHIILCSGAPAHLLTTIYFHFIGATQMGDILLVSIFPLLALIATWWWVYQDKYEYFENALGQILDTQSRRPTIIVAHVIFSSVVSPIYSLLVLIAIFGLVYRMFYAILTGTVLAAVVYAVLLLLVKSCHSWTGFVIETIEQLIAGHLIVAPNAFASSLHNLIASKCASAIESTAEICIETLLRLTRRVNIPCPSQWTLALVSITKSSGSGRTCYKTCQQRLANQLNGFDIAESSQEWALTLLLNFYVFTFSIVTGLISVAVDHLREPMFHQYDEHHVCVFIIGIMAGCSVGFSQSVLMMHIFRSLVLLDLFGNDRNDSRHDTGTE